MSAVDETQRSRTAGEILEQAAKLIPVLRERFKETETLRRIPDETLADLDAAGVFHLVLPKSLGGAGGTVRDLSDLTRTLACGDPTVGWVGSFLSLHNWLLARWPADVQAEVFADGPAHMASVVFPPGNAKPVEGGYLLSGRWGYASGVLHSDWLQLGGRIDGSHDLSAFLVPISEVTVEDTWHVAGMKGTGSNHVVAQDVFVPTRRTIGFDLSASRQNPGAELHPEALYQVDMRDVNVFVFPSVILGAAEAIVALYRERLPGRPAMPFLPVPAVETAATQIRYAKATATLRAAQATLSAALGRAEAFAERGADWTQEERACNKLDMLTVVRLSREAIDLAMAGAGSSVFAESDVVQHILRDVLIASSHVTLSEDFYYAKSGEALLGAGTDPNPTQFFI